ncbi:hypothetical protein [Methylobacterium sp. Leaf466]|uniref:hypothetical protein n=1 Tax=Methylobacterium sp. Leaf466 TaxID=1736386 RepID=UPI0006FEDCB4|nr:hypothetical protein [Methylobacterium sp. Leaf466]KQT82418.1 hypothetical protein ASG59_18675 [Methylobacterium sp. Leaf466]
MADTDPIVLTDGAVILSFDQFRANPSGQVAPEYNAPMVVRNRLINVDQLAPDLRGYKTLKTIYPAADLHPSSEPLQFAWGAYDYVNTPVEMGPYLPYTADGLNYQLDHIAYGRFLDLRILYEDDVYDAKISALDIDFDVQGSR